MDLPFVALPLSFFGVVFGVAGVATWRNRVVRALRRVGATPIRDARPGQTVKLVGRLVLVAEPLRAPLSGRACAAYEVVVESGGTTLLRELRFTEIVVDDGTGRVLVRLGAGQLSIVKDRYLLSGTFRDPTPQMEALLARHGTSAGGVFNKNLRYREGVLEAGERIAALGCCRLEPDPDPRAHHGYREPAQRLVIESGPEAPLLLSDDPETTR